MKSVFEKIIDKLENRQYENRHKLHNDEWNIGIDQAIKIVKQEAEQYNGGWIPCSEDKPKEPGIYNVTAYDGMKLRSTHAKWQPRLKSWNLTGTMAYWKVIAWQPLPGPYEPKVEREAR